MFRWADVLMLSGDGNLWIRWIGLSQCRKRAQWVTWRVSFHIDCVLSIRMSSREIRHPFKRKYVATQSQPKISQAGSLTRKAAINSETIVLDGSINTGTCPATIHSGVFYRLKIWTMLNVISPDKDGAPWKSALVCIMKNINSQVSNKMDGGR